MKIVSRATIGSAALWLVLLLLSVTSVSAQSTKVSTQTGDWYFGSTWIGGVPPADGDHIIISAGHVVNFIGSITVTNLTVSGTLIVGEPGLASTLTVLGSTNITTGGTLTAGTTPATHTAIFNGTVLANGQFHLNPGAGRIINPTFRSNVTINGLGSSSESTVTFDGATTLIGMSNFSNVLITGQLTSTSMTVTGNWTMNAGGSFNPGAGTVHFTGNNAAINGTALTHSFNNVVINKTSGQTLSTSGSITSMAVAGNLTLSQGSLAAPALLTVAGNITQTPGILIAGANIELGGNWTGGATFVHNSGTVTMTGSASQSFSTGTPTLYNLIINKDAGSTFTSVATSFTLTVAHHFTLLEGTYSLPGGMMNVGSDWIHQGGTFTHTGAASYVAFNGSGVQQITSSTLTSETFQSFRTLGSGSLSVGGTINTINTLGGVTMSSTKIFNAPATLNIGTDLIMNGGQLVAGSLTDVKGNWTINGGTFTSGTGTVAFTGTGAQTISGTITTQLFNNVTINKTAGQTLTVGGSATTLTIQGDFTQTQGNFTSMASGTINVAGNWTHDAGTSSITAGIVFNGTGSQSISSTSLTSLTFAHFSVIKPFGSTLITGGTITSMTVNNYLCINGSFTPPAALTINGDASLSSGTLNAGALIDIKGNWTSSLPPNFSAGTGTVTFTGSGSQAINGGSAAHLFNNLTINKPAGQVLSVSGSATMLSIQNFTQTQGDFTPMSGGTIQVYGNWTHTAGIFTPGTATVMFNGSGSSQISSASATISYFHLTVNKTGVLSTGGSITNLVVGGDLSMWGGILSSPGNIDIAGNWDVSGGGFDPGTGTVRFNGAANQFINNGSSSPVWFNNLTVNMTAGMLLTTTGTVSEITLSGNYNQITGNVAAPSTITISGNWTQSAGTFSPGVGTVMFIGGNTQSINTTSPTFYNITVSKVGALSLSPATYNILNDLTITQGLFTVGSSTINVGGNWTRNGGLFLGIGTVTFNGSGAQLITSSALTSETFSSVSVNKSAGTLAAGGTITSLAITGNLTLTQGTLTAPALLTVTGNITHTSGNLVAGANIELSGNWTNGAFFVHSSGTVTMTGGSPQSFSLGTPAFHDLTINKTAGSTFTSVAVGVTVTVAHNFTLLAGTYSLPGGMMNVGGDWIHEGGAFTHTGAAGYVAFNGSVAQQITSSTLTSETFQSFRTVNSGSLSVGGTITTIITVGSINTFNTKTFNAPATLNIGTDVAMSGGQLVAGSLINVGGNWPQSGGTFTPGTGTVVFNGAGAQTISANVLTLTFNNLIVNKTAATLLNTGGSISTLTILGDYTQTSGNFTAPATITLGGNWSHTTGTFTPGTGTVVFNGPGTQSVSSSSLTTMTFNNVTINKASGSSLSTAGAVTALTVNNFTHTQGDASLPTTCTINGNATLTAGNLQSGNSIGVSGNWTVASGFNFVPGTGTVTFNGNSSQINGTATTQFFNNLTVNKTTGQILSTSGSLTTLTILGTYIGTLGEFAPAAITINVGGNWSRTVGAFTEGSSTVVFNGTGTQTIVSPSAVETFFHLTIDKSSGLVNTGAPTNTVAATGNYLQLQGNAAYPTQLGVGGNFTHEAGTLTTALIVFNGSTAQLMSSSLLTDETFGSLIVNKTSGALSVGGTLTSITLTGDFTLTSGNFAAPATFKVGGNLTLNSTGSFTAGSLVEVKGNLPLNAGTFVHNSGTVVFNGTGAQSFSVSTLYNLTVTKTSGSLAFLVSPLQILNDLTIQGNVNMSGTTVNIGRNWVHDSGTITLGSLIRFNGNGAQEITSSLLTTESFPVLTIEKSGGSLITSGTIGTIAASQLTMVSGSFTAPSTLNVPGNVTLGNGSTFVAGNQITLNGSWTNNGGTFTPGTGTLTFIGGSAVFINGTAATQTFYNITVNKSASILVTTGGSTTTVVIQNNYTQTLGNFTAPSNLQIGGNFSHVAGNFTAAAGTTVTFNGAGARQITTASLTGLTFGHLTINKDAGSSLTTGGALTLLTVNNNYVHNQGTFAPNVNLVITGSTTLNAGTFQPGNLLSAGGNWTMATGFDFVPGTGTVEFFGAAAALNGTAPTHTFNNLAIIKTAGQTLTMGGSATTINVLGNITLTLGNFTMSASSTLNLGGNWTRTGVNFTHGTGSFLVFNGSGTQTMTSSGSELFSNMTIAKPSGLVNAGSLGLLITGNFVQSSGDFTAPVQFNVAGNFTLDGGAFNPATGHVYFNGGGPQLISSSSFTTLEFNGLDIVKPAGTLLSVSGAITTVNVGLVYAHNGGTFTAPATLNFAGDAHLTGGTLNSGNLIDIKGNFNFTGGILNPGTGTVSFTGTGAQACTGGTFYNFTVNKSSTLTTSTTVSILHDFTLLNGDVILSGNLSLTGNWTHDQGTVSGTGGVTFTGSGTQVITSSTRPSDFLGALTVNKSGGSLSVTGSMNTLDVTAYTNTQGTFTSPTVLNITGNATLTAGTLTADGGIWVSGNWTNNGGTFVPGAGTVTFNGTGTQTINGTAASQTFYDLKVDKTAGTLLTGGSTSTVSAQHNFTQIRGGFTAPATMQVAGDWTYTSGTFTPGTGTVIFNGGGPQQIVTGGIQPLTFNHVTVDKSGSSLLSVGGGLGPGTLTVTNYTHNQGNFTPGFQWVITGNAVLNAGTLQGPGTISVHGNWTMAAGFNFVPGGGTVEFLGAAAAINGTATTHNFFHFTINKTAAQTLTVGGSATAIHIGGNYFLQQGNLTLPASSTITVGGNWTRVAGTTFTHGAGSTVLFNGTGAQSLTAPGDNFSNFIINKPSGVLNATGSFIVVSQFTHTLGEFTLPTTLTVAGTYTHNGGTLTPGVGTVNFSGSNSQITSSVFTSTTFHNITIGKAVGQGLTVGGTLTSITITGNVSLSGGSFNPPATLNIGGDIIISSITGSLTAGNLIDVKGNWTISGGTFVAGTGTVSFTGPGPQSCNGGTFYNFTVSKSSGSLLTTSSTVNIQNNFTLLSGDVSLTGTLSLTGNWTHDQGTVSGSGGVTFTGGGTQVITSSTRTSDFLGALTVNKSGGSLSVAGTITTLDLTGYTNTLGTFNAPATMNVAGNVTLTAGTVTAGDLITVTGNWTNNAGTFNYQTGTVNFNGTGAQTINGSASTQTFYNFTVTKTAATLLNVGGSTTSLNVQNNYTQTQGNFTAPSAMFVRGDWAHAAGTFTPPTTILFTGPNNQVISSSSLTNVTFTNISINKVPGSLLQTGGIVNTMTVTGYAQFGGDFTPPNLFVVNGNWSHDFGAFNAGSGTVQFGGGGTTSIGGSAPDIFNHLTLAKTVGTTLTSKSPLTIAGNFSQVTGNLTAPSTLIVMGDVSIAAGNTWTAGAQTQVGGNWTGSAFTPGTGNVVFNNAGAQAINTPLPVFNNLTIDKASGTVTVGNATLTVGGYFAQTSGNFTLTGGNMNVNSHWFYDGGTFTPSTGTVTLMGNSSLITCLMSTAVSFGNLTVAKTAGQTLTVGGVLNSITVNGNFNQTSGSFTAPATLTINGNATLNTTGTFTAGSLVDLKGNLTITAGTFAHNSGTLAFTGTGAQSFPTATTYYNLTVNKPSGAISFPNTSSFIVANNFTLTQGDVTATGATINLGGNWTHNAGIMTGAPAITFNGTGPQLIQSSLLSSESFSTVHVNKTAGSLLSVGGTMATINLAGYSQTQGNFAAPGTLNVAGPVLLTAGTLTAGNLITVTGNWTNNGATVTPGTGTVNFNGISAQVINGTAVTQSIGVLLKTGSSALTIAGSTTTLNVTGYTNSLGSFTAPATFNVSGNVTLSSGTFTAGTNMSVSRNWNSNGGSFIPGSNTVTFNSTNAQQIIGGTQAAGFGRLTINNTHSASPQVSVNTPVIVGTQLTLTSGIVQTDLTNVFQLGNGVIVTGGSSASHISGPMQYVAVANGVTAALNFPVGKGGNYGHVLLNVRHTNASSYVYTTEVIQSPASGLGYALAAGTDRVSGARYWNVRRGALATPLVTDNTNLATGVNAPTIRLTYASVDGVLDLPNLTMVKNVNGGTTWFDIGGTASGTPAGTINMTVPSANFDGFSNFALANKTNGNNLQPLPAITSLSPSFGPIGTTVLVNGSSFDQTLANNVVYFGATRATVTAAQPSQLTVTVPAGATYQPVSVMVGGLTAYGSPFTVTIANSNVIDAYSFGPKVDISANPNGKDNIIADIDNDGKPDVVVVTSSSSLSVFRNTSTTGSPSFASHVDLSAGGTPTSVDAGDIDGDGKLDLVATSATANTVTILKNQSTPGTISFATNVNFTTGGTPSSVAIADLNDDFRPDLVVANYADNTVSLFRNVTLTGVISLSSFSAKVDYNTGAGPQSVAIADIDADGKRDVIVANKDDATVSILKNAMSAGAFSSGSLALQVAFSTGNTPVDLAIADFDGDGKPDVASANFVSNTVSIRKNVTSTGVINGTSFEPAIHFAVGTNPRGIAVTDLTGDGKPDIATTNQAGNSVSVLKNLSTTGVINNNSLDGKIDYSTATGPHSIFIGDLEGDGRPDLLVSHNASSILSVIRHKLYQQITFNALSAKTYGDTDFPPTASSSSSLAIAYQTDNDDVAEIAGSDLHIVGAGTVNVTAIQAGNNTYGQAVAVMRPLSVSKAQLTVTADDANRLYGNPNPALIVSYSGFVGADDESEIDADPTAGTTATMFDNIGDYPITITGGSDNNYDFTLVDGTLTVNQKPLTVIADNKTRSYGVANPAFTISYDGLASWDDPSNLDVEPAASSTATQSSNIGIYPITFDDGEDANYDISFVDGSLTIGKANLTVTANDASKTYGTTNPVFSWTYSGFHGADDETDLDTQPTASTSAGQLNDVGTYQITLSGGTDDNYAFTLVNGTLTIGKAELSVTANNATRVYGAADPAFSLSYSGLAPGDQPSVVDSPPTASTSATQFSNTGTYPIALSGGTDNNYTFNLTAGTLTVGKALLIVTSDSKTKKFGEPNPLFTATYSGFLGTDDASVIDTPPTLASTNQFMDPGTYPITVLGAADNNYMMTAVLGTLTIEKAILTATAQNASRIFGAANPPLTITYSGFAGLDDPNNLGTKPTASTTATVDSAPGVYPISASGGADTHYAFNYVNGQLTVTKAAQTISFATLANRQFGDATFQLTAASPAGPVTFTSSDVSVATVAGNTVTIAGVGSTTITATQGGNNFYEAGSATQLLTVVKGSQTISFTAITDKKMGDTSFSLTANASSGLAVTLTGSDHVSLAGLQVTLMKPGRASIAANQAGNNIYNAAPAVTQTFCINPAKPTVTLSNANTPNPILTSSGTEGSLWYLNGSPLPNQTANTLTIATSGIYRVQSKVEDCSSELSDPVVIIITGLFDAETAGIRSYPNPVDDVLEVSGLPSDPDESRAFDMSGRPIPLFFQRAGDVHRTSVGHLPSGLYLVRIKIGAVTYQVKMIKL